MIKELYFAGKTPENLNDLSREDFNAFFAYIYEYYWSKDIVDKHKSISNYIEDIENRTSIFSVSNDKKWWLYLLFLQQDVSKENNYLYLLNTITKIINNVEGLNLDELENYVNKFNLVIMSEQIKIPVVRLFEMEKLCDYKAIKIKGFLEIINIKNEIVDIFKRNIKEENISKKYIKEMSLYDIEKTLKFSDLITQYTEIFLLHFNYMMNKINSNDFFVKMTKDIAIDVAINSFFEVSLKDWSSIDILKEELSEHLYKLL